MTAATAFSARIGAARRRILAMESDPRYRPLQNSRSPPKVWSGCGKICKPVNGCVATARLWDFRSWMWAIEYSSAAKAHIAALEKGFDGQRACRAIVFLTNNSTYVDIRACRVR